MKRRAFLGAALALAGAGIAGAGSAVARRSMPSVLRVGVMTNLTHAPLLAGLGTGRIARALAPLTVETRLFRAGPRVTEALLGDAIDVGTAGPAALVIHHARHKRRAAGLRVLSGCASGGASLIVGRETGIDRPFDLRAKRIAIPQIGTTQDIALRALLRAHGMRDRAAGGDVEIVAVAPSAILEEIRRGRLHGAWLPEPWATRLVHEVGSIRLIDERDLWPGHAFSSAALATRASRADDPGIVALTAALAGEIARGQRNRSEMLDEAYAELRRHVGNPGPRSLFDSAAQYVDFTTDPLPTSFARFAEEAAVLGLTGSGSGGGDLFG